MIFVILLLLSFSPVTPAATTTSNLLRLFTTADQRADLNRQRQKKRIAEKEKEIQKATPKKTTPPPGPQAPPYITFNGLVRRETGPSTVWVNESNNLFQKGFRVELEPRADLSVSIVLSQNYNSSQKSNSKTISLEPGQTLDTRNGDIKDIFEQPLKPEVNKPKR